MDDLISRQAAIDALHMHLMYRMGTDSNKKRLDDWINGVPSAQETHEERTEERTKTHACDLIDRQAAIRAVNTALFPKINTAKDAEKALRDLPSVQPERTCVNCGRTANNGGWYADGRTRCPIEEHYALPKDGYCHLWEKRNVTDDDYPERREDERPES